MTRDRMVSGLFFILGILFALWIFTSPVWADDERNDIDFDYTGGDTIVNDGDVNVPVNVTGGTQTVTGSNYNSTSRALALGNSLGDVDINDCRESTQWGSPIFSMQGVRLNPWCAAEVYDAKGMPDLAAKVRCLIPEIRKLFENNADCVTANTAQTLSNEAALELIKQISAEHQNEDEGFHEQIVEQKSLIATQQQALSEYGSRLEKLENTKRVATKVVNQIGLTDEQRAALAEVFKQ